MVLPNFDLLERIFEGEKVGEDINYEEEKENLKELEDKGLINLKKLRMNQKTSITETGINVVLDERRHAEKSNNQSLLIMITSMYTAGTGGLILSNTKFPEEILAGIGLLLIIVGFIAYFLIPFEPKIRDLIKKFR